MAFNLQLGSAGDRRRRAPIAALIREGGAEGLPGVRAIGVALSGGVGQVSMNIERPLEVPLADVVEAVSSARRGERGRARGAGAARGARGLPAGRSAAGL